MANELLISYPTGATLYAQLFDATGQVWNGSAFAAPGSAAWTDYDIAMSEVATATGIYRASMPAAAAGVYGWTVRKQAGGSPAVSDIVVGTGRIEWSGTAEIMPASTTNITGGTINSVSGSVGGDVEGKVLGGGASAITGTGAQTTIAGTLTSLDALWVKIQKWLRLGFRKDAFVATDHATELSEINANTGTGVGAYASTSDSLEANRDNVDTRLDLIASGVIGTGSIPFVYTLTEPGGIVPIPGVMVEVYTEEACVNCIRRGTTNSFGTVTFWMSVAGTYWIVSTKDGYSFELDSEVVTA